MCEDCSLFTRGVALQPCVVWATQKSNYEHDRPGFRWLCRCYVFRFDPHHAARDVNAVQDVNAAGWCTIVSKPCLFFMLSFEPLWPGGELAVEGACSSALFFLQSTFFP